MKRLLLLLTFISSFAFGQDYDYQQLCLDCAEANGFYCGDDPANWTQYAPLGCVQTSWINDSWEDCVDASDEGDDVVPTLPLDCIPPPPLCDTVYVDVPVYIYETIFQQSKYSVLIISTYSIIEYVEIINTEYLDCDTGLPCTSNIPELLNQYKKENKFYNLLGQVIKEPNGIYIEDGQVKYKLK